MAIDRTGISSLQTGAPDIKYTGDEGPRSPDQQLMASADPMLVEEYQKYVFEMEEQGIQPISFREFVEQVMAESRMAEGGRAGYQDGQLVRPPGISQEEWEMILGTKKPRPLSSSSPFLSVHAYGGRAHPTYTQSRKQRMANGGVASMRNQIERNLGPGRKLIGKPGGIVEPGIMKYGWWDDVKEKVADLIPNEIKDPIAKIGEGARKIIPNELADLAVKAAPFVAMIPGQQGTAAAMRGIGKYDQSGDVGDALTQAALTYGGGKLFQGATNQLGTSGGGGGGDGILSTIGDFAKKVGQTIIPGGEKGYADIYGSLGGIGDVAKKVGQTIIPGGEKGYADIYGGGAGDFLKTLGQTIIPGGEKGFGDLYGTLLGPSEIGGRDIDWKTPLAIGLTAGAIQKAMPQSQLPQDTSGINIGDIRSRALTGSDPDLHFLPPASATTAYAQGGRTGFQRGGGPDWINTHEPGPLGNPAVVKEIEDMREFRIANPDIEDVTDYEGYYDRLRRRKLQEMMRRRTGYATGDTVQQDVIMSFSNYKSRGGKEDFDEWFSDIYLPEAVRQTTPEAVEGPEERMASLPPVDDFEIPKYYGIDRPSDVFSPWQEPTYRSTAFAAQGGRIGYAGGANYYANLYSKYAQDMIKDGNTPMDIEDFVAMIKEQERTGKAQGGRIGAQEGGLMDLGGMEKDYRQEGGFVPIGGEERADDVPARLSKNEFVFTADAVRAAGGGDIDAGAEVMENVMNNLERGGQVSEESQGLEGARNMFATAQRLEGVM